MTAARPPAINVVTLAQWVLGVILTVMLSGVTYNLTQLWRRIEMLEQFGTPGARERISSLESEVRGMREMLSEIKHGQDSMRLSLDAHMRESQSRTVRR